MNKKKNVMYSLKGFELLDVMIVYPENPLPQNSKFKFTVNLEHRTNLEKKLVFVITTITIIYEEKSSKLGSIKTSCIFNIDNIEEFTSVKKEKLIDFPDAFINSLNSISISTTRGVMYSKFSGTFLQSAILPLINLPHLEENRKK